MKSFDVIVVGVGGMGSAVAAHCAARGQRVLALERHAIGHARGSSHGLTRIIRLAYFEHPSYVPLLRRAYALWRELEFTSGDSLLHITGSLDVGWAESAVFAGSLRSCHEHGLAHEVLDAAALAARFPGWRPASDAMAVLQPDGGFLTPERCIAAHVSQARASGATVLEHAPVRRWHAERGGVQVETADDTYEAAQLVLCGGAWMAQLAPGLQSLLVPERQVVGWFGISQQGVFEPAHFPVFVLDAEEGRYYGFPEHGRSGFKIGRYHHLAERVNPDAMDRGCTPADERALRSAVSRYFPAANGPLETSSACLFTNTPDEHFIIDRAPGAPEVLLVSPCSGHGFKFCTVIGEICADLVVHGHTRHDIGLFRLQRFATT